MRRHPPPRPRPASRSPGWLSLRLAVVSPFLDRRHGTELCIIEQIERLSSQFGWDIHIYSQRVEDIHGPGVPPSSHSSTGGISWHKVSEIAGPHLFKYLWWFFANHIRRWRDRSSGRFRADLTYSPGINCFDADAIVVHIVFHEFYSRVRSELRLLHLPVRSWPVAIHRQLYYRFIMFLERRIYTNPRIHLTAVSQLVATQLKTYFQRDDVVLIPNAVDTSRFDSSTRRARRAASRASYGFSDEFVLLLIGNDWKKKGLDQLLRAMQLNRDLPLRLLVVGSDEPALYAALLEECHLQNRVRVLPATSDVVQFYAAADAYVGPSLEDAFGLPVLEAMACGLPVISSVRSGVSAVIEDGINGLLLRSPESAEDLAVLLRLLFQDKELQQKLGTSAAQTAAAHTWSHNAAMTHDFLLAALPTHSS
jgi:glycosyltransferase involved in cell wall biosynthesis